MGNWNPSLKTLVLAAVFVAMSVHAAPPTVAVIGTGDMGDSLGPRFAELGYRVVYGSRMPDSAKSQALARRTGSGATVAR